MISFRLKRPDSLRTAIYAHVCLDYWQTKLGVGVSIEPRLWDAENQRAKKSATGAATMNAELAAARQDIESIIAKLRALGEAITPERLRMEWNLKRGKTEEGARQKTPEFFAMFDAFIADPAQRPQRIQGERTLMIYRTVKKQVEDFAKECRIKVTWASLNLLFFQKFTEYLLRVEGVNNTTLDKTMQRLRAFLRYCDEVRRIPMCDDYKRFTKRDMPKAEQSRKVYLTATELQQIADLDLTNNERLRKVRDVFLFLAHTGLRYSDLQQLRPEHRKGDNLELTTIKNKRTIVFPLHSTARDIWDIYEGRLPNISHQKFNSFVKEVVKEAKIEEPIIVVDFAGSERREEIKLKHTLVGAHTAKRTFVTNLILSGVSVSTLCEITGNTPKSIQKYIVPTGEDARRELAEVWQ